MPERVRCKSVLTIVLLCRRAFAATWGCMHSHLPARVQVAWAVFRIPGLACLLARAFLFARRSVASSSFLLRDVAMSQTGSPSEQPASQPDCQSAFAICPPVANVRPKSLAIRSTKQSGKAARIEAKIDQKTLPGGARGTQNRLKIELGAPRALQSRPGSVSERSRGAPGAS